MNGERLFETFLQAASCTRIQMHQFMMQALQRSFGVLIVGHRIGVLQFPSDIRFMVFRQVVQDVTFLVDLTALDECRLARVPAYGRLQRLAAV